MVNNKYYFDEIINKYDLKLKPFVLRFICREKDVNFSLLCKYEIIANSYFLDMNNIIDFCNKHQCRCYINLLLSEGSYNNIYDFKYLSNYLFRSLSLDRVNELLNIYNGNITSFKKLDIDDLDELEPIIEWLHKYDIYDIINIPSKSGYSLIFRSNLKIVKEYLLSRFSSHIFEECSFNLYIPDFDKINTLLDEDLIDISYRKI